MSCKDIISVIIPCFDSASTLGSVLEALAGVDYPKQCVEIIFSYTPSEDETFKIIEDFIEKHRSQYLSIKLIVVKERGVSKARNAAIVSSMGKYIFLLDDDVKIHAKTYERALTHVRDGYHIVSFPYAGRDQNLFTRPLLSRIEGRILESETFWTGSTLVERGVFDAVGLFNEEMGYPYGVHEDLEMAARMRRKGYRILIDGTIIQEHLPKRRTQNLGPDSIGRRILFYFTSGADSYSKVLENAPTKWKFELIVYFILPLILVILFFTNIPIAVALTFAIILTTITHYRVYTARRFFDIVLVLLGRIMRSYGYVTRKISLLFSKKSNQALRNT